MNGTRFNITLSDGHWKVQPSAKALRSLVKEFGSHPREVVWDDAEPFADDAAIVQISIVCAVVNGEILRDRLIEAVLNRFRPEYESMVEVEVLDG